MTHDKLTALASLAALAGLLSLSAVVSSDQRPPPPELTPPSEALTRFPRQVRESMTAVGLLPVERPAPRALETELVDKAPEPQKVPLATPLNLFSVGACLDQAETHNDLQAARACIAEQLAGRLPDAQQVGQWVCSLPEGRMSQAQLMLEELLTRLPGAEVIGYAEEVRLSCHSLEESDLFSSAVLAKLATHATWSEQLAAQLAPEQLFNPQASTLALEVAHQLALQGNAAARELIETGASGIHGGSSAQMLGAARLGLRLQQGAGEGMGFLTGLAESPFTPGQHGLGAFFAEALLEPVQWEAEDPAQAVALLNRIMEDERFRLSAGRALVGKLHNAPLGASQRTWAQLLESPSFKHLQEQVMMVAPD